MAKRKMSAALQKKKKKQQQPDTSESDSEIEYQRPKKLINRNRNSAGFSSTPHGNSLSFYEGPSTSYAAPQNRTDTSAYKATTPSYANFQSFLESHDFISDDDEAGLLTVSQLAEKRPWTPARNDTYRRSSIVNLNNSSRNSFAEFSPDSIRVMSVPSKHLEIAALHHPASLTLHGYLKLTTLVGTVSILGYNVKEDKSVTVFSSKHTGYKEITTKLSAHHKTTDELQTALEEIAKGENQDAIKEFMDCVGSFTIVVVLEKRLLPSELQFLELYLPNAVEMDTPPKGKELGVLCSAGKSGVIEVSQDDELIADQLNEAIVSSGDTGYRVFVHGAKRSGKSSMLRYLIHTVLNTRSEVYYLDTDPGQTEFTPPGVVSLTKLKNPLLGPPYTHQRNPLQMIFTGSVTAASSPPMYSHSVRTLIKYYEANFPNGILFVNTMGWIEGIGEMCFQNIKALTKPNMLIDFLPSKVCPLLKIQDTQGNCTHVQIPTKQYPKSFSFSSKDLRNFAVMSYFGKCQKYFLEPTYLNSFRPVYVNWDDVAVFVVGRKVQPYRLIEAIQCSIVALCHVDECRILDCVSEAEYPRTLVDEYDNECFGFGLVRAVDETQHLLYIVTPLSPEKLYNVNALIRGNVAIPDEVFLKQPNLNIPLPYTDASNTAPASNRKSVKKRQFIPQQTPKNR